MRITSQEQSVAQVLERAVKSAQSSDEHAPGHWSFPYKHPLWKELNMTSMLQKKRVPLAGGEPWPEAISLEKPAGNQLVFLNGCYREEYSHVPEGVTIRRVKKPEQVFMLSQYDAHGFCALLHQEHAYHYHVDIRQDVSMHVIHYVHGDSSGYAVHSLSVEVAKEVRAYVMDQRHLQSGTLLVDSRVMRVKSHGELTYVASERANEHCQHIGQVYAHLGPGSVFNEHVLSSDCGLSHQLRQIDMDGTKAGYHFKGLSLASKDTQHAQRVCVRHLKRNACSSQLHRSVLRDAARSSYHGMIYVEKGAIKTDAKQQNHHLVLDKKAKCFSRPELEIYADDVVCQHGSTVGVLSEDLMFYLMSRGLNKTEAKNLLVKSFVAHIAQDMPDKIATEVGEKITAL